MSTTQQSIQNLPFHQFWEKDISQMTDQELSDLISKTNQERVSPAKRKATKVREAKKIEGVVEKGKINEEEYL